VSSPATVKREAAKQAVDRLRELILPGEFSAGERLPPERLLARELGVSRSTLREAIRALVVMNVLVSRHGDGTYVSSLEPDLLAEPFELMVSLSDESLFHLFEVRRVLETACAGLAAERISDEELVQFDRILEHSEAARDDPEELLDRDVELHTAVVRTTRNPLLIRIMSGVGALALASRRRTISLPGVADRSLADHARIVSALRRRSPETARAAMEAHLGNVERSFRESGSL
jgi:GntR family transcriptional regulator, transcriptional repressor for pyruvate dehydrogenase complex